MIINFIYNIRLRIYGGHTVYKEFDANLKGYVIVLNGSPATTHIHIPKGERKTRMCIYIYVCIPCT